MQKFKFPEALQLFYPYVSCIERIRPSRFITKVPFLLSDHPTIGTEVEFFFAIVWFIAGIYLNGV